MSREVNMTSERLAPEWYEAMAKATKRRERALAMVARWQKAAVAAEAEVQQIINSAATATEQE